MSVYRHTPSSPFLFDFQFKGQRYHGSTGTTNKAEAEAFEQAAKTKARREHFFGAPKEKAGMAIEAAFGRYWSEVSQHTASANDELARMDVLTDVIGRGVMLSAIDDDKVALAVAKLRGRKKAGGGMVSNATVNRYTECLRKVWRRAAKVWKIEVGDEPNWGTHLLDEPSERVRELTADEETRLFQHLRQDFHPLVRFALMSGLRLANVRCLTWKDVDLQTRSLTVRLKSTKPGGRTHTVPLTTSMVALIANERGNHPIFVFTYSCASSRQKREKGKRYPFTSDGWRKPWYNALEAAGIDNFRFHDTRHTAATRTLRASGNIKVVQKMLGHTDITTTARYAHALTDDIRAAMEAAQSRHSPDAVISDASPEAKKA